MIATTFLLDENISFRLISKLSALLKVEHVSNNSLSHSLDTAIWEFAKREGFTIITRDSDFKHLSNLLGCPPKVIKLFVKIEIQIVLLS